MDNMNIIDQKKSLVEQLQMQMGCDDEDEMPQIVDTEEGYAFWICEIFLHFRYTSSLQDIIIN